MEDHLAKTGGETSLQSFHTIIQWVLPGNWIGTFHKNPLLNTLLYECEFDDGTTWEYAANMIASNIFMESNADGFSSSLLYLIVDHKCSGEATTMANKYFVTKLVLNECAKPLWDESSWLSGPMAHNNGLNWKSWKSLTPSRSLSMSWLATLGRSLPLHGGYLMYCVSGTSLFQLWTHKFVKWATNMALNFPAPWKMQLRLITRMAIPFGRMHLLRRWVMFALLSKSLVLMQKHPRLA